MLFHEYVDIFLSGCLVPAIAGTWMSAKAGNVLSWQTDTANLSVAGSGSTFSVPLFQALKSDWQVHGRVRWQDHSETTGKKFQQKIFSWNQNVPLFSQTELFCQNVTKIQSGNCVTLASFRFWILCWSKISFRLVLTYSAEVFSKNSLKKGTGGSIPSSRTGLNQQRHPLPPFLALSRQNDVENWQNLRNALQEWLNAQEL